ncbi:MAG: CapA family protein [Prevotella sp.]|nr:CapA family protein [Prevotella sp.]
MFDKKYSSLKSLMFLPLMMAFGCTGNAHTNGTTSDNDTAQADTVKHQVTLLFAGDLMQHDGQIKAARTSDGKYDYEDVFKRVKPEISEADIAIANFEVTLGGPPFRGYPQFCAPDEYLYASIDAGFDVLLTANNHCVDTRDRGLRRTIDMMDSLGVKHLGTYKNAAEREKYYPFFMEYDGIRICLLNFTYGTNGIPVPAPFVVNMQDTTEIAADLKIAKSFNPDVIIAFPHWGIEYVQQPNREQRNLVDWMLRNGVDHVIAGHPHVIQPFEVVNRDGKDHLVVYSLGNYVSNMTKINTDGGAMVRMTLTKQNGKTEMTDCDYSLVWVSRPATSGRKNFRIYPVTYPTDEMNANERNLRTRFINSTRTLLDKYNKGVKERGREE